MTPTLFGRWQSRIFLLGTYGLLVTFFFGWWFSDSDLSFALPTRSVLEVLSDYQTVLSVLGYVLLFGFFWDMLYNFMQRFRWDSDWPPTYQFGAAVVEAIFLYVLLFPPLELPLPGVGRLSPLQFLAHYWTVWIVIFLLSQSAMRIWFPRWRYNGGEIV